MYAQAANTDKESCRAYASLALSVGTYLMPSIWL